MTAVDSDDERATRPATPEGWDRYAPAEPSAPGRLRQALRRAGRVAGHEWTLAAVGSVVLAIVMFWPSVRHPGTTIPSDIWDPTLQAWQMAWSGHIMATDPGQLWNSNSFYPDQYTFAYSDTLLGYFPAGMIGTGPVAALVRYNIVFVLVEALAFFGAYVLGRQLGASKAAAGVCGAAMAYAPWHWAQAGHLHVMSVGGIPLALAMLARGHGVSFTRGARLTAARPGWAFAGWCVAAWQISIGFGIGLPFGYVLGGLALVSVVIWLRRGRPALGRRLVLADGLGLLLFLAVSIFMALPYLRVAHQHPEAVRSEAVVRLFSPNFGDFFIAPAASAPWGAIHAAARATLVAPAERTLLPGFALYGLATAGLFYSIWSLRTRLLLLGGTVLAIILAMGTKFFGGTATYLLLYRYVPGFNGLRTPGRLVIWVTLLLGLLAAGLVSDVSARAVEYTRSRAIGRPILLVQAAVVLPMALVLLEGTNTLPHPVVPAAPAAMRTATGPLLVLPSDQLTDENVMLWSTTTFPRMVNGGSGFTPTDQELTRATAASFPDPVSVAYLRSIGVRTVIVLKDRVAGTPYARAVDAPINGLGISRTDEGDTVVYRLD